MATYKAPKKRLHREFMYLNHDTVLNSLSALEAGAVDEIIQKVSEAREGGFEGSAGAGSVKLGGSKKRGASIEEELVRTRTWFSAFESWFRYLDEADAIGTFDGWDLEVRNCLTVGDTIEFPATLVLSPVHKVFRSFLAFAESAGRPGNAFSQKGAELAETKKIARQMTEWMGGRENKPHLPMYLQPHNVASPRIISALQEQYLIGSAEDLEGSFSVVGQVSALLQGDDKLSAIRILRNVPPTQAEVETINEALTFLIEPALELGVEITPHDINLPPPAVVVQPIAIFR